jgi:hypothetical protein
MNKIKQIQPLGYNSKSKNQTLKDYDIILNMRMGVRNCNDLHTPPDRNDSERFDIQEFLLFMKTVKHGTRFTVYHNAKEMEAVEITLHDIRKVFGGKLNVKRSMLDSKFEMQVEVIL